MAANICSERRERGTNGVKHPFVNLRKRRESGSSLAMMLNRTSLGSPAREMDGVTAGKLWILVFLPFLLW